jgi:hypothetical protein
VARTLIMAATTAAAIAISGCGATRAISSEVDPVARAADITAHTAGYRLIATIDTTSAATTVHGTMSGVVDTAQHTGAFTIRESVAGHDISILERLSGLTAYMKLPNQPALQRLTGGKPWIKLDFSRALGALGFSGLPGQGDPTQFLDYLRTVGAKTTRVGTATIDGSPTTHYHVLVDLDNYPKLFPPAKRAAAARGVSTLETITGTHTLPMDAWVDSHKLLRRMSFSFGECVQSQHLTMGMTMNLSNYGQQAVPAVPSPSQAYDLTPLIVASLKSFKPGTCGPAA